MNGKRPIISSLDGVVAAAHPLAAQAGARRLSEGGNAFDAIVATAAALNVVEPYMSGMAGMGLAICWVASERRVRVLDFMAPAPVGFLCPDDEDRPSLRRGGAGTGLPSCLAGWSELLNKYGRGSIAEAFEPAIRLARNGFPMIELNVAAIREAAAELAQYPDLYPEFARALQPEHAELGKVLRQPELANVFQAIASRGIDYLYGGALGAAIITAINGLGGCLALEDLSNYHPQWLDPLSIDYRGFQVFAPPPPSHGYQYLLTLAILGGFDLSALPANGTEHLDTVFRAARLAAGKRIEIDIPTPEELEHLFAEDSLRELRATVESLKSVFGPTEHATDAWRTEPAREHTTSFSAADRDGNMVVITQSLGQYFGSGVIVPGTGIALNDLLYYGDLRPQSPHRTRGGAPQAIPMVPSLVLQDGEPVLAFGTPGSFGISQTQAQVLVQHLDFGLDIQDAIDAPRGRLMPGSGVNLEDRISSEVVDELRIRGHDVQLAPSWTMFVGGMHGIRRVPGTGALTGGADPRRDGWVAIS